MVRIGFISQFGFTVQMHSQKRQLLGGWLGVANRAGQTLHFMILPVSGVPIARSMIQPILQRWPRNKDRKQ